MDADSQQQLRELDREQNQQLESPVNSSKTSAQLALKEQIPDEPESDSQESSFSNTDADTSDMDSVGDGYGYRRRRAQLIAGLEGKKQKRTRDRRYSVDGTHRSDSDSEFSSVSTSEDVELSQLTDPLDDEETGLNKKSKEHRKRRRRRHKRLESRIGGSLTDSISDHKEADRNLIKSLLINVILIVSWYLFSLSISIYNKWMFSEKYLNFKFPLFVTCLHMIVQFCLSTIVLYLIPSLRPRSDNITNPRKHYQVRRELSEDKKPLMTWMFYFTRIGPCGAATGLDIGLGNMSLKFISLTFYTMCKSSSLAFVLSFAFLFRLESPSIKLILIIATMTVGVIMMVAGEVDFSALGFVLVIAAAFFSGFRWALTQILLLRNPATSNPFSSIFFLAPVMFISLLIIAIPVEGFRALGHGLSILADTKGHMLSILILLFPGCLAFMMTASEFALLQRTSVVTLSICGIFKEVVTITAAGITFDDPLTPINISGLLVTIAAISAYNYIKIAKMRKEARKEVSGKDTDNYQETNGEAAAPILLAAVGRGPSKSDISLSLDSTDGKARAQENVASSKSQRENE